MLREDPELSRFCEAQHPKLVGILELYVNDAGIAEELAQEALVRLCQHWPRVQQMDSPAGWLIAVAMNLGRSWWRRRYAERRAHQRHGPPTAHSTPPDVETALVLRDALADLTPRQRQAVILRYFGDLSVTEASIIMGCAEGTVRSLTAKGIASLRARDDSSTSRAR